MELTDKQIRLILKLLKKILPPDQAQAQKLISEIKKQMKEEDEAIKNFHGHNYHYW